MNDLIWKGSKVNRYSYWDVTLIDALPSFSSYTRRGVIFNMNILLSNILKYFLFILINISFIFLNIYPKKSDIKNI